MNAIEEGHNQTYGRMLSAIDEGTMQKIIDARNDSFTIRDRDIRTFALEIFEGLQEPNWTFKASDSWILSFKKRHEITSRKVTHIVTRRTLGQETNIQTKATEFVNSVKRFLSEFPLTQVINADQIGFPLEMSAGRTLDFKGARKIRAFAQRMSAVTHSCTVLPTITIDGKLCQTLFMQLQEPKGEFPLTWTCKRSNVYAVAGK